MNFDIFENFGNFESFDKIEDKKKIIESFRPLTQGELERYRENFLIEYTHDSNAIEGNTLTLRETALVLQGITIDKKPLREHLEAIGHKDAFLYILEIVKGEVEISEKVIKDIHSLVLLDRAQDRGIYRRVPVIITGAAHNPPQPYLIEPQMWELMQKYQEMQKTQKTQKLHAIERAALFHLIFEGIHPFIDGNGRTGRLILNLELIKAGLLPVNIKFADRRKYYDCFDHYYSNGHTPDTLTQLIIGYEVEELERHIKILDR